MTQLLPRTLCSARRPQKGVLLGSTLQCFSALPQSKVLGLKNTAPSRRHAPVISFLSLAIAILWIMLRSVPPRAAVPTISMQNAPQALNAGLLNVDCRLQRPIKKYSVEAKYREDIWHMRFQWFLCNCLLKYPYNT